MHQLHVQEGEPPAAGGSSSPGQAAGVLLTVRQTAERLAVHEITVYRWAQRGLLQPVKLGTRTIRFTPAEIDRICRGALTTAPADGSFTPSRPSSSRAHAGLQRRRAWREE